jgi:spheroidene monooxygenase
VYDLLYNETREETDLEMTAAPAQTVTLSLFRFDRPIDRAWAFGQMGLARRPLRRTPEIGFHKLMGTGRGEGFTPGTDFSTWGLLAVWPSEASARRETARGVWARFRSRADRDWTAYLAPLRATGEWDGAAPFAPAEDRPLTAPVAALTRATIRPGRMLRFWSHEPDVTAQVAGAEGCLFKTGLGEVPMLRQVTFSIWRDLAAMRAFAAGSTAHGAAARAAFTGGYFAESLFARFAVLDQQGAWNPAPIQTGG